MIHRFRPILIALAALVLQLSIGSVPAAADPLRATASGGIAAFGTLASFGTWEMELAPAYTRLAVLERTAARRLDAGTLSVAVAVEISLLAVEVRDALDASRRGDLREPTPQQRHRLDDAKALLDSIAHLLEP